MAYGGHKLIMDAAAELERDPVSKHQIQPEYGDEQADAGRDWRTRLARPNSQARTRTGNIIFPCSADHVQDWQPYPVDPYSCYVCDYTYIHTWHLNGFPDGSNIGSTVSIMSGRSPPLYYSTLTSIAMQGHQKNV